ncbi:MAG TPA: M1 family metallopeptidase [Allosphingosinicella sp.]|nr:M1 family metallopeptidase [Allosphingosinicella sp.]
MRLKLLVSALALASALAACSTASRDPAPAPAAATQVQRQIPSQLPRSVRPLRYSITAVPDAANLRFAARTEIDIEVLERTDRITLNAADLTFGEVALHGGPDPMPRAPHATDTDLDAERQTASFRFGRTLDPGRYRLTLNYTGIINTQAAGLFALDYDTAEGRRRALFTQFEAPDARRFFPSWDEPQFRTPYDLRVVVPAGQNVVSNMPEAGREPRPDGSAMVTFRTTPPMSSYLLFLAVGEFDRITTAAAGTEIGVVSRRGSGEQGRYALDASARILPWYNDYFGTPYPLPKLDNVAGPGSSQFFGAMENWGAIFSFESILLVDPATTSEARRQQIFSVAAHEIAHQWFGNLVTMAWWDDLWLNEGFASWMATKATDALHPEWETSLSRIDTRETAMRLDSLATTHPIVQRLETVEQISQAFDDITYEKGEAVIAMLEDYVGEDAWRAGVRSYISRHRLGNTTSDDLWRAVEAAANRPITAIATQFTNQPGVPLIRVEEARCAGGRTSATLRQGEFSRDRPDKTPLAWTVPVIASAGGAELRTLVRGGSGQASIPGCGPLVVNYGQNGYYRTLYAAPLLARLTQAYPRLRPIDQIGLLADAWALGLAGYQPASSALDLVDAAPANPNTRLALRIAGILGQVHGFYGDDPARQALVARYAGQRLGPIFRRLGWIARPGESANDAVLRAALIATLGGMGDPAVVAEANRRFASGNPAEINGPLRETILWIVAANATPATWDRLRAQARAETNPLLKAQLYGLLASARDEALARRALEVALTPEPGATNSGDMVSEVAKLHPELAFDFALRNRERVDALIDASSRSRYFARLAQGSSDRAMIQRLRDYAERHLTPQSRAPADQAIAAIEDRARVREQRVPDITRWFDARR